jgi:hypothetical protein
MRSQLNWIAVYSNANIEAMNRREAQRRNLTGHARSLKRLSTVESVRVDSTFYCAVRGVLGLFHSNVALKSPD